MSPAAVEEEEVVSSPVDEKEAVTVSAGDWSEDWTEGWNEDREKEETPKMRSGTMTGVKIWSDCAFSQPIGAGQLEHGRNIYFSLCILLKSFNWD
ncbi:hypothetical protein NC653_008545 [Populus alba x Populus x berolinensis]|uniref:Uncharacterized protein n=1 Tax=Populus alba x Populus x berolinensis TaxID=444605 RepID=A0AAD6R6P5_9ROSI|nr:hypothetical protein NC653_008545 [Populus alba x Populus x berolinensis]